MLSILYKECFPPLEFYLTNIKILFNWDYKTVIALISSQTLPGAFQA